MSSVYPTLSPRERDRRWSRTRELMRKHDLSCLLVFGAKGRERYEGYLANDQVDGVVLFPMEGAPAHRPVCSKGWRNCSQSIGLV